MSVEFRNVSKALRRGGRVLFDDLNFRIEAGERAAILGAPKSGKSSLLRLICGTDIADIGEIERTSSVSWPIPLGEFLVGYSTVATNIRFVMRLYGVDSDETLFRIADLADISEFLNRRLADCPRYVKTRVAWALGVGLGFDVCLFDERVASSLDKEFRPRALEILKALSSQKTIVVATSQPKEVADLCDTVFVLNDRKLTLYRDAKEGLAQFKALMDKNAEDGPDLPDAAPEVVEDEFVLEIGI